MNNSLLQIPEQVVILGFILTLFHIILSYTIICIYLPMRNKQETESLFSKIVKQIEDILASKRDGS